MHLVKFTNDHKVHFKLDLDALCDNSIAYFNKPGLIIAIRCFDNGEMNRVTIFDKQVVHTLMDLIDTVDVLDLEHYLVEVFISSSADSNRSLRMLNRKCLPLHDPDYCLQVYYKNDKFFFSTDLDRIVDLYPECVYFDQSNEVKENEEEELVENKEWMIVRATRFMYNIVIMLISFTYIFIIIVSILQVK